MSTKEHQSLIGKVVDGRFEIIEQIGAGAMGEVFLARHSELGVLRALKIIGAAGQLREDAESRFRREAIAMSRLQHQSIARVVDFGRMSDGRLFLAMEYIDGGSLRQRIEEKGAIELADAASMVVNIAEAVAVAHEQGVVHRDLKPANILLERGDTQQIKVIDFGLVKLLTDETLTDLTAEWDVLGTPSFMSPEQCLCEDVGPPADIFAWIPRHRTSATLPYWPPVYGRIRIQTGNCSLTRELPAPCKHCIIRCRRCWWRLPLSCSFISTSLIRWAQW